MSKQAKTIGGLNKKWLTFDFQRTYNLMMIVCLWLCFGAVLGGCQGEAEKPSSSASPSASARIPLITVASPGERLSASAELIQPTANPTAGTFALQGTLGYPQAEDELVFAPLAGRITHAYVSDNGDGLQTIRKGQALYVLESPEWLNAQLDYLLLESFNSINLYKTTESQAAQKAWRTKWRNEGVPEAAIQRFLTTRKQSALITISAPISGHLHTEVDMPAALEGQEVAAGDALMRLTPMREMVALVPLSGGNPGINGGDKVVVIGEDAGSQAMVGVVEGYEPRQKMVKEESPTSPSLPILRIRVDAAHGAGDNKTMAMRIGARVLVTPTHTDKPRALASNSVFLPSSALLPLKAAGLFGVFVATGEGQTMAFRRVQALRRPSGEFEVLQGLTSKDRVARHPALLLDPETQILSALTTNLP